MSPKSTTTAMTDFSINKILFGSVDSGGVTVKNENHPSCTELAKLQQLVETHFDRSSFADLVADILPFPDMLLTSSCAEDDDTDNSFVDVDSNASEEHMSVGSRHHYAMQLEMSRLSPPEWTRRQRHNNMMQSGRYDTKQTQGLNRFFDSNRFPTSSEHLEIGKKLGLSRFQVKKWFQNRRAKERRKLRISTMA